MTTRFPRTLSLKVTKAFKQVEAGKKENEDKDGEVALLTSAVRNFLNKKGKGKSS